MVQRIIKLPTNNSFFLFGPRGSGKSTLLHQQFQHANVFWIDLLLPESEHEYSSRPSLVLERWQAQSPRPEWVVIDEVQKVPEILNVVHKGIETHGIKFALTGSSARKLRHGPANMLAGRAFVCTLHPFCSLELGVFFSLEQALAWGTLPGLYKFQAADDKKRFLRAYTHTYLKEEIQQEQLVRKMPPFRRFLDVAAQSCGDIVNFSRLGREAFTDYKSVERYFEILIDTLIGYYLEPWHTSVRKQQAGKPKFYLFDCGVTRSLQNVLDIPLQPGTYSFGKLFEQFMIMECVRLNSALEKSYRFYYLRTRDSAEIDLIVERPGKDMLLVEFKSGTRVDPADLRPLRSLRPDFPQNRCLVLSREKQARVVDDIHILPWHQGLAQIFDL